MGRSALLLAAAMVLALSIAGTGYYVVANARPTTVAAQDPAVQPAAADAVDIVKRADDLPPPIARRAPEKVVVQVTTKELNGYLDDGTTFTYWTFDGTVPGPLVRARVGDTVEVHLKNDPSSKTVHSIDLHAVNGPGGGAGATQVAPGEEKMFSFKALNPGVYVYHCASPHIPTHIANGMYGLIVIEPEDGLAPVDREFYVMQGEIYTVQSKGTKGHLAYSVRNQRDEHPAYVVFNGKAAGLTGDQAMQASVGERVRIFVGNGGPNLLSSFHVIGEVFDKVHEEGASEATSNVQTTLVPAGGAAWVEFTVDVPGKYTLVDHALGRAIDKGAVAQIVAEGPADPEIFDVPAGQETMDH